MKQMAMDYRKIITIEPDKMGGKPCIRGLRITVSDVLDYLASGMTEAEILADFPDLNVRRYPRLPGFRRRSRTAAHFHPCVKLLFDENLSPALRGRLSPKSYFRILPRRDVGLKSSTDRKVWDYAGEKGYTIVTKDADFRQRSFLFGPPPKVIWIGLGNCSTRQIAELLRKGSSEIEAFATCEEPAFLKLR